MTMSEGPVARLAVQRPDPEDWDQFVRGQVAGAFACSLAAWGALKSQFGWDARKSSR